MKGRFQEFVKKPAGKLILACSALLASWVMLFLTLFPSSGTLFPGKTEFDAVQAEIAKERKNFETLQVQMNRLRDLRELDRERKKECWRRDRDGDPETELRILLNAIARKSGVELTSLDSVQTSRVNSELYYADLSFSSKGDFADLALFMKNVEDDPVELHWKSLDIGMERRPPRQTQASAGSRNLAAGATQVATSQQYRLNGTIRIVGYEPDPDASSAGKSGGKAGAQ